MNDQDDPTEWKALEPATSPSAVICLSNENYEASLERGKVYLCVADPKAESLGLLRVRDESGETYLYPKERFAKALYETVRKVPRP